MSEGIEKNISIGGKFKSANNPQGAYFKVLIVFAQFAQDNVEDLNWPLNQLPVYANNLIAQTPSSNYQAGTLSDYWKKMSTGRGASVSYDFIGDVYSQLVILPSAQSYHLAGKNFKEILLYYFPGTEIKKLID